MSRPPATHPASLNSTNGEPIHRTVCDRMKQLRKKRGWTLEQLASLSGVSRSMLSQIERGGANPTLTVAYRIAQAFGLTLGELVDEAGVPRSRIEVSRADDRQALFREDEQVRIRTLSPLSAEKDVEFYELLIRPGGTLESAPHFSGTREFLTIEQGSARVWSAGQSQELSRGDSAHFPADVEHKIENTGSGDVVAFLVDIYHR